MCLQFAKSTIQWPLALQSYNALEKLQSLPYKDTNIQARRWRYKLTVSLKFAKSAIQRYKIQGWMLAVQKTYSVRDICSVYHNQGVKVYHTKTVKFKCGRWHHQLRVSLKLPTVPCKDTKIQGWTLATQTYYGVAEIRKVNHTKIQQFKAQRWTLAVLTCKTMFLKSAQSLPYKDTNIQARTLALQTCSVPEFCEGYLTKMQKLKSGSDGSASEHEISPSQPAQATQNTTPIYTQQVTGFCFVLGFGNVSGFPQTSSLVLQSGVPRSRHFTTHQNAGKH